MNTPHASGSSWTAYPPDRYLVLSFKIHIHLCSTCFANSESDRHHLVEPLRSRRNEMEQMIIELIDTTIANQANEMLGDTEAKHAVVELMACALIAVVRTEQETDHER